MVGEMDVYEAIDTYSKSGDIAYVHFRTCGAKFGHHEVFVDEDVDMVRALRIYHRNGYDGVIIPDHTPQMECAASWHAGMAYALGWMRAALRLIEEEPAASAQRPGWLTRPERGSLLRWCPTESWCVSREPRRYSFPSGLLFR